MIAHNDAQRTTAAKPTAESLLEYARALNLMPAVGRYRGVGAAGARSSEITTLNAVIGLAAKLELPLHEKSTGCSRHRNTPRVDGWEPCGAKLIDPS